MSKQMCIYAETNSVGSKCSDNIDCTEEAWNAMTEDEQKEVIAEMLPNVVDIWVAPAEEDE